MTFTSYSTNKRKKLLTIGSDDEKEDEEKGKGGSINIENIVESVGNVLEGIQTGRDMRAAFDNKKREAALQIDQGPSTGNTVKQPIKQTTQAPQRLMGGQVEASKAANLRINNTDRIPTSLQNPTASKIPKPPLPQSLSTASAPPPVAKTGGIPKGMGPQLAGAAFGTIGGALIARNERKNVEAANMAAQQGGSAGASKTRQTDAAGQEALNLLAIDPDRLNWNNIRWG